VHHRTVVESSLLQLLSVSVFAVAPAGLGGGFPERVVGEDYGPVVQFSDYCV